MGLGGTYLPPVVAQLTADSGDLIAKLAEAKALLDQFDKSVYTATLEVDSLKAIAGVVVAEKTIQEIVKDPVVVPMEVNAHAALMTAGLTKMSLEAIASQPINFKMGVDANLAAAAGAAAGDAAAASMASSMVSSAGGGGGAKGGGGFFSTLFGGLLGGIMGKGLNLGGIMGGGGGGAMMGAIGLGGLPGFMSLGSMAGLGAEHILATGLGIGGSMAGGAIGGGLLALGSAGKLAVGGGIDMGVSRASMSDLTTAATDYQNLQAAIQQYGAASTQAAQAQTTLNMAMATVPAVARAATMATAIALTNMQAAYSNATGPAEKIWMSLAQEAIKVATLYIPMVGAAATRNFTIMQSKLQPLFTWLSGPTAMGIFQHLENLFAQELPTSIAVFTQGLELFIKITNDAAGYTGGFMKELDKLLTLWNSPAKSGELGKVIGNMIYLFHTWLHLFWQLGVTIYDIFRLSAGLGAAIAESLTVMLKNLDTWLTSVQGKKLMGNLFSTHKNEFLAFMQLLPPIIGVIGKFYLTVVPGMVSGATAIISAFIPLLKILASNQWMDYGIVLAFVATRLNMWGSPINLIVWGLALLLAHLGILQTIMPHISAFLSANPWMVYALGVAFLATKFGLLKLAMTPVMSMLGDLGGGMVTGMFGAESGAAMLSVLGAGAAAIGLAIGGAILGALVGSWLGKLIGGAIGGKGGAQTGSTIGGLGGSIGGGAGVGAGIGAVGGLGLGDWFTIPVGAAVGAAIGAIGYGVMALLTGHQAPVHAPGSPYPSVIPPPIHYGPDGKPLPGPNQTVQSRNASINASHENASAGAKKVEQSFWASIGSFFAGLLGDVLRNVPLALGAIGKMFGGLGHWFMSINWGQVGANVGTDIHNFFAGALVVIGGWIADVGVLGAKVLIGVWNFFTGTGKGGGFMGFLGSLGTTLANLAPQALNALGNFMAKLTNFLWNLAVHAVTGQSSPSKGGGGINPGGVLKTLGNVAQTIETGGLNLLLPKHMLPGSQTGSQNGLAQGGAALPGQKYTVGEHGPEILTMFARGGYVTPLASSPSAGASQGATNISVPISVTVAGSASPQTAQQVGLAVQQAVRQQMGEVIRQMNSGAYSQVRA